MFSYLQNQKAGIYFLQETFSRSVDEKIWSVVSSTIQNFETHVTYNYLMDFYQNEEVVDRQRKMMAQRLSKGQHLSRDKFLRFTIVSDTSS